MAKDRTSMQRAEQVKLLIERGYSKRSVQKALRISNRTLNKIMGHTVAAVAASVSDGLAARLDWEYVRDEVHKRGTTIKQLHRELAPEIPYLSFWRLIREKCPVEPTVSMRLAFLPGEKTQVDFTDGLLVWDQDLKTAKRTQLFVGVLAFSSRVFAEFVWGQKIPTFIALHEKMFHYFGGVTKYVIVDNLKSGVTRADIYDPDVNPTFTAFANHMGFAVLPARPVHPRDKAKGESNINVVQRQFYQEVRDRKFRSLTEQNLALREFLARLDIDIMKDHGVSRLDRFSGEKDKFKPLPDSRFELSEWREAKVHPDCHIQLAKNFYSVPFQFVGRSVRVRLTEKLVEIFDKEGPSIAVHERAQGIGKTTTCPGHYPERKAQIVSFSVAQAIHEAKAIGPITEEMVKGLLGGEYPLKYLRRVQGILRLRKSGITNEAIEHGSKLAVQHNRMRLAYIKSCALYFERSGARTMGQQSAPHRDISNVHLHTIPGGQQ